MLSLLLLLVVVVVVDEDVVVFVIVFSQKPFIIGWSNRVRNRWNVVFVVVVHDVLDIVVVELGLWQLYNLRVLDVWCSIFVQYQQFSNHFFIHFFRTQLFFRNTIFGAYPFDPIFFYQIVFFTFIFFSNWTFSVIKQSVIVWTARIIGPKSILVPTFSWMKLFLNQNWFLFFDPFPKVCVWFCHLAPEIEPINPTLLCLPTCSGTQELSITKDCAGRAGVAAAKIWLSWLPTFLSACGHLDNYQFLKNIR